ncbi:hypothetical protein A9264_03165 [Vibrio sp. UCD-FRSSP16_10]|uniref:hypothetical protein n=1 Tax=unclassified Vibrio TaxID=2614977 RepID=UPI0007FD5097|nr:MULTISPECIES: hypothetical protein [unclassified Vibrio]OBT12153.1 hypothetical protein A9260_04615 [Vibrio sp. UCD-FRSSP16_30]OBT20484.1 hypothetical protein A9264_03165 [Vibrio sp. UCD-FRSSP16_10]
MKLFVTLLLCFSAFNVNAAQKAVTEEGDIVLLNGDGTWLYEDNNAYGEIEIKTNPTIFKKPISSNFILKSKTNNSAFAIDTKEWAFVRSKSDDTSIEYSFNLKAGDLYGMAITERIEIDSEKLAEIAFENAKEAAPDAKVVKKEYRIVNGKKLIYMEMTGTMKGIKFKYMGYYFSDVSGSTQFVVYTGASLVSKYNTEIDNILNGFTVQ